MSAIAPRDLKSVMFDPSNKTPKDPKKGRNSYKLKLDPKQSQPLTKRKASLGRHSSRTKELHSSTHVSSACSMDIPEPTKSNFVIPKRLFSQHC